MSEHASPADAWRLVGREVQAPVAAVAPVLPSTAVPGGEHERVAAPASSTLPESIGRLLAQPHLSLKLNGRLTRYTVRKVQHRWLSSLAPWRDRSLGEACGLWLAPCNVVHTLGLWHAVDVVFLKADGTIERVAKRVRPWRFVSCRQASSALRLRAGTVQLLRLKPGMALDLAA